MKYALISPEENNRVIEVSDTPFECATSLEWVECEDDVRRGFTYSNGAFSDPKKTPARIREKRDSLLTESDWVTIRATDTGDPVPTEWVDYRQALRDIPEQTGFPENIDWPQEPES